MRLGKEREYTHNVYMYVQNYRFDPRFDFTRLEIIFNFLLTKRAGYKNIRIYTQVRRAQTNKRIGIKGEKFQIYRSTSVGMGLKHAKDTGHYTNSIPLRPRSRRRWRKR